MKRMFLMIEYLKNVNDAVWVKLLQNTDILTDNVFLNMLMLSSALVIILSFARKFHYSFGIVETIFLISADYMIERIPMIHERMHLALTTTAGIIQSSESYSKAFTWASGLGTGSSKEIAQFLYQGTEIDRLLKAGPENLYQHFFQTLDQITEIPILGRVDDPIGVLEIVILLVIIVLLFVQKSGTQFRFLRIACVISLFFLQKGSVWSGILIFFTEMILCFLFHPKKTT